MKQEVYKIINLLNGKVYIGITIQGSQTRWLHHLYEARSGSSFPIHNAIRKYGKDSFKVEVIEEIEDKDYDYLKEREKYWIQYYDSYNRNKGYNLTLGGDGTFGRTHSEETKDKIRQKALGRKVSIESRKRMSDSQKKVNRDYSDLGKRSNKKRWANPENKLKSSLTNPNNKEILQLTLDNIVIEKFRSASEAARQIGVNFHGNISSCAVGKLKTAYGFKWAYLENIDPSLIENFEKID